MLRKFWFFLPPFLHHNESWPSYKSPSVGGGLAYGKPLHVAMESRHLEQSSFSFSFWEEEFFQGIFCGNFPVSTVSLTDIMIALEISTT
jgi:hypothetical protein